jgi:hypothetical protein
MSKGAEKKFTRGVLGKIILVQFHQILTSGLRMGAKTICDIPTEQVNIKAYNNKKKLEKI